ncbi:MAG: biotin/lipoate A/B protein ligase family protein [Gemmataceae bacterium]
MSDPVMGRWHAASWEILPEGREPPVMHVALDEALLTAVARGERGPTLRFWAWSAPAVILGRFQSFRNEIDSAGAAELGLTVVRRISGGGAMLVQPGMTITYSLYVPAAMLEGMTIRDSYQFCDQWVVDALRSLGADVSYVPLNDIASSVGKVGGAAQARRPGVVLHHTTIAYQMNSGDLVRALRIGREKISDKGIPSANKRVHPLGEQVTMSRDNVVAYLISAFRERFGGEPGRITDAERVHAAELVVKRYAAQEWTLELP